MALPIALPPETTEAAEAEAAADEAEAAEEVEDAAGEAINILFLVDSNR